MQHRSFAEFVAFLRQAEIVPRPDGEDWKAMIARISVTGRVAAELNARVFHLRRSRRFQMPLFK
jgi:hypothetical protein